MASSLPPRNILMPSTRKLKKAPPLYRWDDGDEENSVVTLDPALMPRPDRAPKLPSRNCGVPGCNVPTKYQMPPRRPRRSTSPERNLRQVNLPSVSLRALAFSQTEKKQVSMDIEPAQSLNQITAANILHGETKKSEVSLVFCIRRTGCGSCRGHAMQLASLVENTKGVSLIGVIKPEDIPEAQLMEFYTDYFPFPLYQDDEWKTFQALGSKKVSVWSMISNAPKLAKRYYTEKIRNIPFGGDLYTRGGLLIFDQEHRLRFVYYEKYGDILDMEAVEWAIEEAKRPLGKGKPLVETLEMNDTSASTYTTFEESRSGN